MSPRIRHAIALLLAVTAALSVLALVGVGAYAVVAHTLDWTTNHIPGPNLTAPLSALIGSLVSAVIAGVVGYIGGTRVTRADEPKPLPPFIIGNPPVTRPNEPANLPPEPRGPEYRSD